jgi:hypothetical protein
MSADLLLSAIPLSARLSRLENFTLSDSGISKMGERKKLSGQQKGNLNRVLGHSYRIILDSLPFSSAFAHGGPVIPTSGPRRLPHLGLLDFIPLLTSP